MQLQGRRDEFGIFWIKTNGMTVTDENGNVYSIRQYFDVIVLSKKLNSAKNDKVDEIAPIYAVWENPDILKLEKNLHRGIINERELSNIIHDKIGFGEIEALFTG